MAQRMGIALRGIMGINDAVDAAKLAEGKGFDGVWLVEVLDVDTFSLASVISLSTSRIKIGLGVVNPYSRVPVMLAMGAATVDQVSKGRFLLGIGSSNSPRVEGAFGLSFAHPIDRVRECVEIVRAALTKEQIDYTGKIFNVRGVGLGLKPYGEKLPIYVGALGPKMLEVAGEVADGVLLTFCPPWYVRKSLGFVMNGLTKKKKRYEEFDVACYIITCVSRHREEAERIARRAIAYYASIPTYLQHFKRMGFLDEVERIKSAWDKDGSKQAEMAVSEKNGRRTCSLWYTRRVYGEVTKLS